jgi:hypothetical protein
VREGEGGRRVASGLDEEDEEEEEEEDTRLGEET